jgi:Mg2+ and Co2+ transporter CorA
MEKTGKGIITQHNRSMKHNSMNGVKYFFALMAVFLYPVDVLASPRCLAFIIPETKSTNIAPIVAAIHRAISTMCIIMCSFIKL